MADKDTFRRGDGKVCFIDWSSIKNTKSLVDSLERFLINVLSDSWQESIMCTTAGYFNNLFVICRMK